jgi:hypothetical protein
VTRPIGLAPDVEQGRLVAREAGEKRRSWSGSVLKQHEGTPIVAEQTSSVPPLQPDAMLSACAMASGLCVACERLRLDVTRVGVQYRVFFAWLLQTVRGSSLDAALPTAHAFPPPPVPVVAGG